MKKLFAGAFALLMFISFTAATVSALPPGLAKKVGTNESIQGLPPGLYKRIDNLPPGIRKKFFPTAELQRVSFDKRVEGVLESIVTRRDGDFVKLQRDSNLYEVDGNVDVWIDDMERSLSRLREGMTVELKIKGEKVVEIHAESHEIVTGTIEAINNTNTVISVKSDNETKRYDIGDADLFIDGVRSRLTRLEKGMKVTLRIEDGKVMEIEVESQEVVTGTIEVINTSRREITVKSDNRTKLYDIDDNVNVWIDNTTSRLSRLEKGMGVVLTIEEDKVVEIYAQSQEIVIGTIEALNNTNTVISVKSDNETKRYDIRDADLWIDGVRSRLAGLEKGMEVTLTIEEDKVVEVYAKSQKVVTGTIEAINNTNTIISVKSGNQTQRYDISNAYLWIDGVRSRLAGLEKGMEVTLTIEEDKVVEIEARSKTATYEGKLMSIRMTGEGNTIVVQIGGNDREFTVVKSIDLSRVAIGDIILIDVENNEVYRIVRR